MTDGINKQPSGNDGLPSNVHFIAFGRGRKAGRPLNPNSRRLRLPSPRERHRVYALQQQKRPERLYFDHRQLVRIRAMAERVRCGG